ncbi:Cytokinin riboside 5'-monophosphate phosphoribohydrolase LOG1, partial [Ananas comosus]
MGLVSQAVYNGGRHVLGVIPKTDAQTDNRRDRGEVRAVSGIRQRKAEMARQADAFIALPGLLNVDGYYNSLLSFVDKAVDEGFVTPAARHTAVSAPTPQEFLSKVEDYVPIDDGSGLKLSWEMEQIGLTPKSDISR